MIRAADFERSSLSRQYLTCDWLICVQVVKVHQSTVDTYLEDIIMGSIDKTAEEQVSLGCLSGS